MKPSASTPASWSNKTWYRYEVMRWVFAGKAESSGTDKSPVWAEVELEPNQREGTRAETYHVTVRDDAGKTYRHSVGLQEFQSFEVGAQIVAKINSVGQLKSLAPLRVEAE